MGVHWESWGRFGVLLGTVGLCEVPGWLWEGCTGSEGFLEGLRGSTVDCGGYKHMGGYGDRGCRSRMLLWRRQDVGCSGARWAQGHGVVWGCRGNGGM